MIYSNHKTESEDPLIITIHWIYNSWLCLEARHSEHDGMQAYMRFYYVITNNTAEVDKLKVYI